MEYTPVYDVNNNITGYNTTDSSGNVVFKAATPPTPVSPTAITSSSGTLPKEDAKLGTDITAQSSPDYVSPVSKQYLADIDAQTAALTQRQKDEEAAIQAQFDALRSSTESQQRNEVGYTSAGLARAGGYLGVSGSGTGVLLNLAQTHRNEMSALESKRQAALSQARNAYTDKQFELARLKATEAKAIEKEAYDRQQAYNKSVAEANKKAADETKKKNTEINIYNAISSGYTDPLDIYNQLGGDTSIEDINNFLTKSTPKDKEGKSAYSNDQIVRLLGAVGKDGLKVAQEYINEHGYDEDFRKKLTPAQKVAFDSVYREKAKETASEKPLNILDIQRYNELYPDAGVVAGDTESIANAKINKSNSPESVLRSMVVKAQNNGNSYDKVVSEINTDNSIKDKQTALSIAKEVYGVQDKPTSKIEMEIAQLNKNHILTPADIRSSLLHRGYKQEEINNSSVGSLMDQIGSFLFGNH